MTIRLTESQRRHLAVFLEHVDRGLARLEATMAVPSAPPNVFRVEVDDVAPDFAAEMGPVIEDARARIHRLGAQLGVSPAETSRFGHFQALLMSMIVNLEDAGSRGLRAYGDVDPGVGEALDPAIEQIRRLLVQVAARLQRSRPGAGTREEKG